jgi:predicted Zn-dependent protease
LNLAGTPPPAMDGRSLLPLIEKFDTVERPVFGETDYPLRFGWAPLRSVRTDGFEFIEAPRSELYDLGADGAEIHNLYTPWDNQVKNSRAMLADLRSKKHLAQSPATISQQTIEELEALGYIGQADLGSATNVPEPSFLPDPKDKIEEQNLLHAAMMASEDKRVPAAREALEKVLQLDSKSFSALRQLGELELHSGEYANAIEHLKAALALHPDDPAVALLAAESMETTRDLAGARQTLDASLERKPDQLPARLLLGRVYMRLGKPAAAHDQFEAAQLIDHDNEEAAVGLAEAEVEQGSFAEALKQLAALSHSKNPHVFDLQAQALAQMGKPEQAHQAAARAQQLRRLQAQSQSTSPR